MARGDKAKAEVLNKIKNAFEEDYIGIIDKKVYVWGNEGNERVQIAIALTCPKTSATISTSNESLDFEKMDKNLDFTEKENETLAKLLERI